MATVASHLTSKGHEVRGHTEKICGTAIHRLAARGAFLVGKWLVNGCDINDFNMFQDVSDFLFI